MAATSLAFDARKQRLRKLERMSLWSCAFNSLFTACRRPDAPGLDRPLSFGEACCALEEIVEAKQAHIDICAPELLRVCLAQMLAAGYRPQRSKPVFKRLLKKAKATEEALTEYGYVHYGRDLREPWQPPPPEYLSKQVPPQVAFPRPTEISYDGNIYTVTKTMLLHCPAAPLARFIDPEYWITLSPFLDATDPVDRKNVGTRGGWRGVLREVFSIDWNGWTTEYLDVHLKVDYTVSDDVARSDYSLMYDEHDQLRSDDGFAEIRKIPGYSDWCSYTGKKSLKFSTDLGNLVAPGVLFMGLEREALGIAAIARDIAPRRRVDAAKSEQRGRDCLERILQAIGRAGAGRRRTGGRRRLSKKR